MTITTPFYRKYTMAPRQRLATPPSLLEDLPARQALLSTDTAQSASSDESDDKADLQLAADIAREQHDIFNLVALVGAEKTSVCQCNAVGLTHLRFVILTALCRRNDLE